MPVRQVLSNYLEVLIYINIDGDASSVPLTCSIPMWRAASGSELSKWNFTAENKSPWPRAASANAWHSSDEGRPHCRDRQGVDGVNRSAKKTNWRTEDLTSCWDAISWRTSHSPFHVTGWSQWHFLDTTNTVWPAERGCRGSFGAGRLRGPWMLTYRQRAQSHLHTNKKCK